MLHHLSSTFFLRWLVSSCGAGGCALAVSGCLLVADVDRSRGRGDLTVYYSFAGSDCVDAGVDEIIVDLGLPNGGVETFVSDCASSAGGLTITSLRAGTYDVWVSAYGTDHVLYYESATWRSVYVSARVDNGYDVDVPVAVGDLSLGWTFFGDRECIDVHEVRVTVEDPFGVIYDDAFYDCEDGAVLYSNVASGDWYVWMDAIGASGEVLYLADGIVQVLPNTTNVYDVDLN